MSSHVPKDQCIIEKVRISKVKIDLAKPYKVSYGIVSEATAVVIRVQTKDGIVGYGEANPLVPFTAETIDTVYDVLSKVLAPLVVGKSALNVAVLYEEMGKAVSGNIMAKGALDMAMWDIVGKFFKVPVSTLLGGAFRTEIPLLWSMGVQDKDTDKKLISAKLEQGFNTFMLKMGSENGPNASSKLQVQIDRIGHFVKEMHYKHENDLHVVCDANQGWSPSQARQFIVACNELTKDISVDLTIEQPLPKERKWDDLKRLSINNLSADESVMSLSDAAKLCGSQVVDVLSVKVSKNGGISGAKRIAEVAHANGVSILMNSMLDFGITQAAALQLAVTLPNLLGNNHGHCFMSVLRLKDDFTNFRDFIKLREDGSSIAKVLLPTDPGLGVKVDEDKLKKYEILSTEVLNL